MSNKGYNSTLISIAFCIFKFCQYYETLTLTYFIPKVYVLFCIVSSLAKNSANSEKRKDLAFIFKYSSLSEDQQIVFLPLF